MGVPGVVTQLLYVPNVGDLVFDGQNTLYRVEAVDAVTALPTLLAINLQEGFNSHVSDPDNLMHGLRSYEPHIVNRVFVDPSTSPAVVSVDARYRIYGSEATKARLFLGSDTSVEGTVVSQKLSSAGIVISDTVDLESLYPGNNTVKRPGRFHTDATLADGERVTLVVYNAAGKVCGEHPFIIRNAGMISGPTASSVYIEDVELITDLLSPEDNELVINPLHTPLMTNMFTCRVRYSNGLFSDHAVDGNKVKIHGITAFNTSLLGPMTQIVLSYYPSPGEPSINVNGVLKPSVNKIYKLANRSLTNDPALKLYIAPVWVGNGYRLLVYLTDVQYNREVEVSTHCGIKLEDGSTFRGNVYGRQQNIRVSLNMDIAAPGRYPGFVHTQQIALTLNPPGSASTAEWIIDYGGDGFTYTGDRIFANALLTGNKEFRIDGNETNLVDWLSRTYRAVDPLFDPTLMTAAPEPTHIRLEHGNADGSRLITTIPVTDWDKTLVLGSDREWDVNYPLKMVWLVIANGQEKVVGITALSIKPQYNPDGD